MDFKIYDVNQQCIMCDKVGEPLDTDYCEVCESCYPEKVAADNERNYERSMEDYYGSDQPQTVEEQYQAAAQQKRELKR